MQPSATVKCKFYVERGGLHEAETCVMNNRRLTTINKPFTGRDSQTLKRPSRNFIAGENRRVDSGISGIIKQNKGERTLVLLAK